MGFLKVAVIILAVLHLSNAQGLDSQGKEFIVGFLGNTALTAGMETDMDLIIVTASNTPADVTVTMPLFNAAFSETITVSRGTAQKVTIPVAARGSGVEKSQKGIHINSTQDISVFGVNKESKSTDAYIALPLDVLGTEYRVLTYEKQPELMVLASQDNTAVTITLPPAPIAVSVTYAGTTYQAGSTLSLNLNKYEVFHALGSGTNADFTGARIVSDKPVGVLSGNQKIKVPTSATTSTADHLTEMMLPVDTWGKLFVTSSTPDRTGGDTYRFLAAEDGTTVTLSGGTTFNLNADKFREMSIATSNYQTVTSNKPILVSMFAQTFQSDGPSGGDPSMTLLPPVLQYASDYTWSTVRQPDGQEFDSNSIAVVIETSKISGLRLDGQIVTWEEQKAVTGSTKTHLWKRVTPGSHNIYHIDPAVVFMGAASGTAPANSYAYLAGLRMAKINTVCVQTTAVAGDIIDNDCDERIDEETQNGMDDDSDGRIDEDIAMLPRVDGQWSSWSSSGPCSVACGSGFQIRTRSCDNPAPSNGGFACVGESVELVPCSTSGPCSPGPVCREGQQRCLAGVTCNTNTGSCNCPNGQLGNGYIECVPEGQYLCFAEGDPHVHSWGGAITAINLPCWYRLGQFAAPIIDLSGQNYDNCFIDVQALNELTSDGMYYVRTVKINVNFLKYDTPGYTLQLGTDETFTITQEDIRAASGGNPWTRTAIVRNGVAIIPSWDDDNDFAILEIDQCGFRIKFRPYVPGEPIPMELKPGVTVSVPTNTDFITPAESTVCRGPEEGTSAYKVRASNLKMGGGAQALIHDVLTTTDILQTTNNSDYGSQCDTASSNVVSCAPVKRPLALRLCSGLVNSKFPVLMCLTASNVNPMDVFNDCLRWACSSDTAACSNYLDAITTNECSPTLLMNEILCSTSTLNAKIAQFSA